MSQFSDNLTELMARRRMSQRDLAARVGVSQPLVSRWVLGRNNPDFEQVTEIAAAFQVAVDMLISGDLAKVTDREIELRRSLARAVETVGVEEAIRRILVAGSKPEGAVSLDVKDETGPAKARKGRRGTG